MKQQGFSIVELMVSITIGMVLVAALLGVFSASTGANGISEARTQMNEDASYALQLLAKHIRMADYRDAQGVRPNYGFFACDNGFANGSGTGAAATADTLNCNTTAVVNQGSMAVTYHADQYNSTLGTGNLPTDCQGNTVAFVAGTNYSVIENRFFLNSTNNTLNCVGNGGTIAFATPLPVVENIEAIELTYGAASTAGGATAGYRTSAQLGTSGLVAANIANWRTVNSVRICITMRSQNKVAVNGTFYETCNPHNNAAVQITDGYARKSYTMHVALRNRLPL